MYSEIKVADYKGGIRELAGRHSDGYFHVPFGRPEVHKYGLLLQESEGSYLVMVSGRDPDVLGPDYDVVVTAIGPKEGRVKKLMGEFQASTGIEMRPAPKELEKLARMFESLLG